MFQFTREFIINDNIGKLEGGVKFLTKNDTLFVDNMINIRKKDVNAIYKHTFEPEAKEKVTIKASAITGMAATDVVRLVITLGLRGKVSATFNDQYPDHSRQLFYETTGAANAADVIDGLLDSVASEATISKEKFAKIYKDGTDLVIEGPDCYTIVKEVRLAKLPQADETAKVGALLTGYEDWDPIVVWKRKEGATDAVDFVAAAEGNGNTVQILKNMRLQTWGNINPYGTNIDERPLPKGQYDQYMVELVTERRHIGHDVMGSIGTSLTTVVFYVLASGTCEEGVSSDFEAALAELCEVKEVEKLEESATPSDKGEAKRILAHTSDLPAEEGGSSPAGE